MNRTLPSSFTMSAPGLRDCVESTLAGVATGASEAGKLGFEGVVGNGGNGR
jgi:hypothetical protein